MAEGKGQSTTPGSGTTTTTPTPSTPSIPSIPATPGTLPGGIKPGDIPPKGPGVKHEDVPGVPTTEGTEFKNKE
jgi:hypothetical protein